MKRTDITALFPDATDDQIDKLMSINGGDINKAKGDLEEARTKLSAVQSELAALKSGNEPDALKEALGQVDALKNELAGIKAKETVRAIREKVAGETKVPADLLTGETEEACAEQAKAILSFASSNGYPSMRDAGEVHAPQKNATRDKFAEWAKDNL